MSTPFAERAWPACLSALQLDRFLMEELSPGEASAVRAHLASCARCEEMAAALRLDCEAAQLPPLRLVPVGNLNLANSSFASSGSGNSIAAGRSRGARWAVRAASAGVGLAAAASLFLVFKPAVISERTKGAGYSVTMFVQHQGEVRRAGPGDAVAPGDAVRFAVTTPREAHVAVLSLDPRGRASIYYPVTGRAAPMAAGAEVPLPLGTKLDATTGEERVVGLFCAAPVELEPIRAALEAGRMQLPENCQVTQWSFVKR